MLFVYVGSAIAERSKSIHSLSYSASKKLSVEALLSHPYSDFKSMVFSPPYMNTSLLPQNSWPRREAPELVLEPDFVAKKMIFWIEENFNSDRDFNVRHFDWIKEFDYDLPHNKDI